MKKTVILLIGFFQFINLYSQDYYSQIDSIVNNYSLSNDNDWVISFEIDQPGLIPMYDSLGNSISNDPNGTYIFTRINNHFDLQKFDENFIGEKIVISKRDLINISNSLICNYNKDSIKQAENEWIYPYIYKHDSLQVYIIQQRADHEPSFRMYFRTKQLKFITFFDNINLIEFEMLPKGFESYKNLNYEHNINTFLYRVFINFSSLLKKYFRIRTAIDE